MSAVCSIQGCDPGLASDTLITGHRDRDSPEQSRAQEAGSFYFDMRFNKVEAVELDMEQAGGGKESNNVSPHHRRRSGDRMRNAKLSLSGQTADKKWTVTITRQPAQGGTFGQ